MSYINNLKTFVRVYELGSMSAAARDQRVSAAVASARIGELEKHLGTRLFSRTTRSLQPTEQGGIFYKGARRILEAIEEAETAIADAARNPRGSLHVAAPLGIGKRLVAPLIPDFRARYPNVDIRLRLSDRRLDLTAEALDLAFFLGTPEESSLRIRPIAECPRLLCASPAYVARRGMPRNGRELVEGGHDCLLLRFPGAQEFVWTLSTPEGPRRFEVGGAYESDDGDVLTGWALAGHGIILKPRFEVAAHLEAGRLVPVATETPPFDVTLALLYPHKRLQDPKARVFIDFMVRACRAELAAGGG
ncbi:LysR family transcriptional regulator [Amaricoccus solimangrovi]|uniref:LysR family transcriptional regulator n=1 Tax=Amaricoccus solimangrovi TaxID=2589815 RepID=A0A501WVC7_9RHOB|nr:LysR family transcriptional regulator [Amaricoccus solimangrovi]TPE52702.1 LysR family transcriptional regulator [Amaricoccus solimangrovi]